MESLLQEVSDVENLKCIAESGLHPYRLPRPRPSLSTLALHRRCCSPAHVGGSSGSIASPGMAGAPRSVPLYPAAKVRTRSKGEANWVAKNSKAHRTSGVALCTTAEGKPKRPGHRVFGFANCTSRRTCTFPQNVSPRKNSWVSRSFHKHSQPLNDTNHWIETPHPQRPERKSHDFLRLRYAIPVQTARSRSTAKAACA